MLSLIGDPLLEFPDGFALRRKLDVGVQGVNLRAGGVAHERHADFLQDAGLHQARVEGVAEIVETDVADSRILQRGFPRSFHDADRTAVKVDQESLGLATFKQVRVKPLGEGDLA